MSRTLNDLLRSGITCLLLSFALSTAHAVASIEITFARNVVQFLDGRIVPSGVEDTFDCSERIYGVFKIGNLGLGAHHLQTRWRGPSGKIRWINSRRLTIRDPDRVVYLSSSIEFRPDSRLYTWIDPSAGLEQYIGTWTVEALDQSRVVGSGRFEVLC